MASSSDRARANARARAEPERRRLLAEVGNDARADPVVVDVAYDELYQIAITCCSVVQPLEVKEILAARREQYFGDRLLLFCRRTSPLKLAKDARSLFERQRVRVERRGHVLFVQATIQACRASG